jgi:hypothetical protein
MNDMTFIIWGVGLSGSVYDLGQRFNRFLTADMI